MNSISKNKQKQRNVIMVGFFIILMALILTMIPAYAEPAVPDALNEMLTNIIFYVGLIFQTIGILLGIYAIGQMIMAYKDAKPGCKDKSGDIACSSVYLDYIATDYKRHEFAGNADWKIRR